MRWEARQFVLDCIEPYGKEGFYHEGMINVELNELQQNPQHNEAKEKRQGAGHKIFAFPQQLLAQNVIRSQPAY